MRARGGIRARCKIALLRLVAARSAIERPCRLSDQSLRQDRFRSREGIGPDVRAPLGLLVRRRLIADLVRLRETVLVDGIVGPASDVPRVRPVFTHDHLRHSGINARGQTRLLERGEVVLREVALTHARMNEGLIGSGPWEAVENGAITLHASKAGGLSELPAMSFGPVAAHPFRSTRWKS